jgi:hypothetical protein
MREAWTLFFATAKQAMLLSALWLAPLLAAFWWVAEHFGERSKRKRHLRGAQLVSLSELETDIARYNRRARAREYGREMGWKWRLAGETALRAAGLYTPAHIAGVSYPWRQEQGHAMLVGTTGMGKTVSRGSCPCSASLHNGMQPLSGGHSNDEARRRRVRHRCSSR